VLSKSGYQWNAEADDSPYPYPVPGATHSRLIRLPVSTDDWDFVRRMASPRSVLNHWKREVQTAMKRGTWVILGSHPSVLGARRERMDSFHQLLAWLAEQKVIVMTAGEGAGWWRARTWQEFTRSSAGVTPE
jgi:hypothetical protein